MRKAAGSFWLLTIVGAVLGVHGQVHAETAGVLPPILEHGVDPSVGRRVTTTVETSLRGRGIRVVPARDIQHIAKANRCQENARTCALYTRTDLNADFVVLVTVFSKNLDGMPTAVGLTLVFDHTLQYGGRATIDDGVPENAARRALEEAMRKQARGPGPWLVVEGRPEGAQVFVDDKPVGRLPLQVQVAGGQHRVVVQSAGHAPFDERVQVPRSLDAEYTLDIVLQPVLPDPDPSRMPGPSTTPLVPPAATEMDIGARELPRDRPPVVRGSTWNWILGGVLVASGVALAAYPVSESLCRDMDLCRQDNRLQPGIVASAVGAAAAVGAGIAVLAVQPFTVRFQAGHDHAGLSMRGSF